MSGFVAGGPTTPANLINDGFWPNVDAEDLRSAQRIDSSVTPARLEVATVAAMISVNKDLLRLKLAWQAAGHATLEAVPSDTIAGKSILVQIYRRAIYCAASAEVAERYRSYDSTNSGEAKASEETSSIDEYRRDQRWAVRDLLGVGRTTVELI